MRPTMNHKPFTWRQRTYYLTGFTFTAVLANLLFGAGHPDYDARAGATYWINIKATSAHTLSGGKINAKKGETINLTVTGISNGATWTVPISPTPVVTGVTFSNNGELDKGASTESIKNFSWKTDSSSNSTTFTFPTRLEHREMNMVNSGPKCTECPSTKITINLTDAAPSVLAAAPDLSGNTVLKYPYSPGKTISFDVVAAGKSTPVTNVSINVTADERISSEVTVGELQALSGNIWKRRVSWTPSSSMPWQPADRLRAPSYTVNMTAVDSGPGTPMQSTTSIVFSPDIPQPVKGVLTGSALNDTLDATLYATAPTSLVGLAGDDTYVINKTTTKVTEAANKGTDTIISSVTYTLPTNVENLTLSGTVAINGIGNAVNNVITGNSASNSLTGMAGNDTLIGNEGNDILIGGAGNDTLTGGDGADIFVLDTAANATTNRDLIQDFVAGSDKIRLKATTFSKIGKTLTADRLWIKTAGGSAQGTTAYLVYDPVTGILAYDTDGNGKVAAIPIATLGSSSHPATLSISDLVLG
jgi:Ca2+-binding RTX toxin-like protein